MFCQNIINILVIKKLLYHYNKRFWRLTLLCSRLHCKWVHVMAKKEIIKAIVNFQFGLHLSGYNCFLADYFVTAEAWYFPNKTELASRKTVLLITLVVNYCPHTYYLCQFLWGELIAFGQEWVYCGMLYNHTSSRAWLLILFRYWYHPINYHEKL